MAPLHSKVSEYSFKDSKTDRRYVSKGSYPDFELKDYCPAFLRKILELQNIEYTNYMQSIYGDEHLLHFVASGRFGNVLVSSVNERFVIKILKKSELKVMLEMLPNYYHHLRIYRASLLSKLYGLHAITLFGGGKARIAVMSNGLRSCLKVHRCYDLKGTTIGRSTTSMVAENCPVLKDVDFDFCFYLDPIVHLCLLKQIKYDCEFLEAEGIMDYSFLLGIHIEGPHEGLLNCKSSISRGNPSSCRSSTSGMSSSSSSFDSSMDNLDDFSEGSFGEKLSLSLLWSTSESDFEKFGIDMPVRAMRTRKNEDESVSSPGTRAEEYYDAVLNFGIVDIFQRYDMSKRIEHLYKSFKYKSYSVTAVNPKEYSTRFQDFLGRVFQSDLTPHPGYESSSTNS